MADAVEKECPEILPIMASPGQRAGGWVSQVLGEQRRPQAFLWWSLAFQTSTDHDSGVS